MAKQARIQLVIDAKNKASRELKDVSGALGKINGAFKAMKAAIAGLGLYKLTQTFTNLTKRGGDFINIQRAFNRALGTDGTKALDQFREATHNLVGDMDLMVQYNRAVTLGAAKNADEFAQLAKTAITLGRALGVDAGFALESLSLGIGRQSRLILDNLGLIVSIEEANKEYAAALGKTADQLTLNEQREAFRAKALDSAREKIRQLGGVTENAADNQQRFRTTIRNATDALGEFLAKSPKVADFFDSLDQLVRSLVENMPKVGSAMADIATTASDAIQGGVFGNMSSGPAAAARRETYAGFLRSPNRREYMRLTNEEMVRNQRTLRDHLLPQMIQHGLADQQGNPIFDAAGIAKSLDAASPSKGKTYQRLVEQYESLRDEIEGTSRALEDMRKALGQTTAATQNAAKPPTAGRLQLPSSVMGAVGDLGATGIYGQLAYARGRGETLGVGGLVGQGSALPFGAVPGGHPGTAEARALAKADADATDSMVPLVNAVGSLSIAAIQGTDKIENALIPAITGIVQSIPGINPLESAVVGLFGGIANALFNRNHEMPVRVNTFGADAKRDLKDISERPMNVTWQIVDANGRLVAGGESLAAIQAGLERRSKRDAVGRVG